MSVLGWCRGCGVEYDPEWWDEDLDCCEDCAGVVCPRDSEA